MMKPARAWAAGAVLLALGAWVLSGGSGNAADKGEGYNEPVRKIAKLLENGDEAGAKKEAQAVAKKVGGIDNLEEVMNSFKLRTKKGLGVGSSAGQVKPDGIEAQIINQSRKGPRPALLEKHADALAQMGYDAAAIAEVALQSPPEKDEGKKTKKAWNELAEEMRKSALEYAKAAKAKDLSAATTAVKKLNTNCNNCHSVFRD